MPHEIGEQEELVEAEQAEDGMEEEEEEEEKAEAGVAASLESEAPRWRG